ncbi:MAG: DegV family protein [Chloroflexota bacterium]|nr:DegV family protein [Chloroflexota bacterium]
MTVKVVTDSTCDILPEVAQELGIIVVPLFIHFGNEVYQDGVDLSADEFYQKLVTGAELPKSSAPPSSLFTETYERLAAESDEIISIHISTKLSATYNCALIGKRGVKVGCRVEVIDSFSASIGLGILVIAAAKMASSGADLNQITAMVTQAIPRIHYFGMVDTLEYLYKGGRIGKAQAFLGSLLNVKPLLTVQDGEVCPLERVRSRSKAITRLCELTGEFHGIKEMAIAHATTPDELEVLAKRIAPLFPQGQIYKSKCGATIGTYVGPGCLTVALIEEEV